MNEGTHILSTDYGRLVAVRKKADLEGVSIIEKNAASEKVIYLTAEALANLKELLS